MLLSWLRSSSSRKHGRKHLHRHAIGRLERLEERVAPAAAIDLADPSLYGISGRGPSSHPSISADGQLVAFTSTADNLVANDFDKGADAFVYNRSTGAVTLVSVDVNGYAAGV